MYLITRDGIFEEKYQNVSENLFVTNKKRNSFKNTYTYTKHVYKK